MAAAAGPPPHGHPHPHHPHVRPSPIGPFSEDKTHKDPERYTHFDESGTARVGRYQNSGMLYSVFESIEDSAA